MVTMIFLAVWVATGGVVILSLLTVLLLATFIVHVITRTPRRNKPVVGPLIFNMIKNVFRTAKVKSPEWVEGKLTPQEVAAFAPTSHAVEAGERRAIREFYGDLEPCTGYEMPEKTFKDWERPIVIPKDMTYDHQARKFGKYVPGLGIVRAEYPEYATEDRERDGAAG